MYLAGTDFFNLGNTHLVNGDYSQAMQCIIQSRDLRWRHVGSGTVDKILDKYFSERTVDEDELLGLGTFTDRSTSRLARTTCNILISSSFAFCSLIQPIVFTILGSCSI